jgi:hypothetical protein
VIRLSDARAVLNIIGLLTDKEGTAAQIKQWDEAWQKLETARAEHNKRDAELLRRERACEAAERALAKREEAVTDRELKAQGLLHRAEDAKAQLDAMRAEVRKNFCGGIEEQRHERYQVRQLHSRQQLCTF